jgi:hypothetical protein
MKTFKSSSANLALLFALFFVSSCATMRPKSNQLHRAVTIAQQEIQYEHCRAASKDWMRYWRNQWDRPYKMTRIPFTQLYIY